MSFIDSKCLEGCVVHCTPMRYPAGIKLGEGVTIYKIFLLIFFMFQGIWNSWRGLYFVGNKINNMDELVDPSLPLSPLCGKFYCFINIFI
jgi:hypothetical protein